MSRDRDDLDLAQRMARMVEYLTGDEYAQLKRELVRMANQPDTSVLPQGFSRLIVTAKARGFPGH